jgi:hypothetical protein
MKKRKTTVYRFTEIWKLQILVFCPVRDLVKCNLSIHRGILAQTKVEGRSCIVYTTSPSKRTDAPKDPVKGMKKLPPSDS